MKWNKWNKWEEHRAKWRRYHLVVYPTLTGPGFAFTVTLKEQFVADGECFPSVEGAMTAAELAARAHWNRRRR